jgi:hypothetical protein
VARIRLAITLGAAALTAAVALTPASGSTLHAADREQTTKLISRATDDGVPNGGSTNPVISGDRRYARILAFQSHASDLVKGDSNDRQDVFAIRRTGDIDNEGSVWKPGKTILVSQARGGKDANGKSFDPDVDGSFRDPGSCVAFLSDASNLVGGDTNDQTDAFLSRDLGDDVQRVSLPGGDQAKGDTKAVTVSGDCSRTSFVIGNQIFTRSGGKTHKIDAPDNPSDPDYAQGETNDLVFAAEGGIYLSENGTGHPRKIAGGGKNPAYNAIKRQVVAYEKRKGDDVQIAWRDVGDDEHIASRGNDGNGNRDSRDPVVVNSGFYIGFESDATNLGAFPGPQAYLYTDVRKMTQVRSVDNDGDPLPGGGRHPAVSFYANYIFFSSPAPLGKRDRPDQIFLRYLGPV